MKNKTKKSGFIFNHRYAIGFFLYTVVYNFLIVTRLKFWQTPSGGTYMHHIIDYKSLGFRSGLLPGSVFYGIFGEHSSPLTASVYETVLLLLFFAGMSYLLEKFVFRAPSDKRSSALVIAFVYLTGPFTFSIFTDTLGMLDVYWLFFSLLFFFIMENKVSAFFVPVLFALSLAVHMSFVITYLVMFSILLLYRVSIEEEKQRRKAYIAVFALSMVFSAGLGIFFVAFQKDIPMTVEEFNAMLESRGGTYFAYYDYVFYDYNIYENTGLYPQELYSIESPVLRALSLAFAKIRFLHTEYSDIYMTDRMGRVLRFVFSAIFLLPVLSLIYRAFVRMFKESGENRLRKFTAFLMMAQFPFTVIVGCIFSLDIIRWFAHAFIISLTMLMYVMYKEQGVRAWVLETVERVKGSPAARIYLLAYFFVNFAAYT